VALRQWGERHLFAKGERHSLLIDKGTGKPVPFMSPQVTPDQAEVRKVR